MAIKQYELTQENITNAQLFFMSDSVVSPVLDAIITLYSEYGDDEYDLELYNLLKRKLQPWVNFGNIALEEWDKQ
jgi:hypothetical protein